MPKQPRNMKSTWHATTSDSAALSGAGRNDLALGDLESAARRLDRALEIDRRDPGALKGRAEIDAARREPKKALDRLNQALEIDPFDTEALYSRGRIRAMLGDAAGSKRDLDLFKHYKNDHAELLELRGLLIVNPNNNALRGKVAAWMFAHGRDSDGLGWAKAILASDPDHAATNSLLADYYSKRPNEAGAGELLSPAHLAGAADAAMTSRWLKNPYVPRAGRHSRRRAGLGGLSGLRPAAAANGARTSRAGHGGREARRSAETAWHAWRSDGPARPEVLFRSGRKRAGLRPHSRRRSPPGLRFHANHHWRAKAALAQAQVALAGGTVLGCRADSEGRPSPKPASSTRTICGTCCS